MKCLAGTTQANFLSDVSAGVSTRRGFGGRLLGIRGRDGSW